MMKAKKNICTLIFLTMISTLFSTAYSEEFITPESFTDQVTLQPVITKLIEEDDIEKALQELNILHGAMAEEGWALHSLVEYVDDEDFEGFIVTYKRKANSF